MVVSEPTFVQLPSAITEPNLVTVNGTHGLPFTIDNILGKDEGEKWRTKDLKNLHRMIH